MKVSNPYDYFHWITTGKQIRNQVTQNKKVLCKPLLRKYFCFSDVSHPFISSNYRKNKKKMASPNALTKLNFPPENFYNFYTFIDWKFNINIDKKKILLKQTNVYFVLDQYNRCTLHGYMDSFLFFFFYRRFSLYTHGLFYVNLSINQKRFLYVCFYSYSNPSKTNQIYNNKRFRWEIDWTFSIVYLRR